MVCFCDSVEPFTENLPNNVRNFGIVKKLNLQEFFLFSRFSDWGYIDRLFLHGTLSAGSYSSPKDTAHHCILLLYNCFQQQQSLQACRGCGSCKVAPVSKDWRKIEQASHLQSPYGDQFHLRLLNIIHRDDTNHVSLPAWTTSPCQLNKQDLYVFMLNAHNVLRAKRTLSWPYCYHS